VYELPVDRDTIDETTSDSGKNTDGSITITYYDGTTNIEKVEAYIEIKGCTDPKYKEYKKKYTKDDGSCKTLKNKYKEKDPTVNQLGKDLKTLKDSGNYKK
jgi:hypothetical protein